MSLTTFGLLTDLLFFEPNKYLKTVFIEANFFDVVFYHLGNVLKEIWKWLSKEDYKNARRFGTALLALATITVLTLSNYKTILTALGYFVSP